MPKTDALRDRVAVVTGGASGIGAAVVADLRARGAVPVVWDLAETSDIRCDVSDAGSVQAALDETVERFGVPTLLFASAGMRGHGPILELGIEDWNRTFAVNTAGVFLAVQAVARALVAAGKPGSLVVAGSVAGVLADPNVSLYSASKAAVMHFVKCAARELGEYGIRVNAVAPGPTDTPMLAGALTIPGFTEAIEAATPLGGLAKPEDISAAVIALMELGWVTGQVLLVDGGEALSTARGQTVGAPVPGAEATGASGDTDDVR